METEVDNLRSNKKNQLVLEVHHRKIETHDIVDKCMIILSDACTIPDTEVMAREIWRTIYRGREDLRLPCKIILNTPFRWCHGDTVCDNSHR